MTRLTLWVDNLDHATNPGFPILFKLEYICSY